jgi:hypothetical protein
LDHGIFYMSRYRFSSATIAGNKAVDRARRERGQRRGGGVASSGSVGDPAARESPCIRDTLPNGYLPKKHSLSQSVVSAQAMPPWLSRERGCGYPNHLSPPLLTPEFRTPQRSRLVAKRPARNYNGGFSCQRPARHPVRPLFFRESS